MENSLFLTSALQSDIPALIRIHMSAFENDNAARLMFKSKKDYEQKLQGMLTSQISDPNSSVIKAVSTSTSTNEILGWLGCEWIGYPELGSSVSASDGPAKALAAGEPKPAEGERTLRSVMRVDFARVQEEWMAGKQYIHIGTAVTHPSHQRKGVGSALVRWATSKADRDGVPCWIQSSPVAHGVYYHCGFRDVGRLEMDLREFAPGGREGKMGWGGNEFVYMLRLPDTKKEEEVVSVTEA